MSTTRDFSWPRILVEGAAIVVSILLAFSIDSWWDERQQEADLRDSLVAMLEENQIARDKVNEERQFSTARQKSMMELIELSSRGQLDEDDAHIDSLLSDLYWFADHDIFPDGSANALVASGKLGRIQSERLRRLIAGWSTFAEFNRYQLRQDFEYLFEVWSPYIRKQGNLPQLLRRVTHLPGFSETEWPTYPRPPSNPIDHTKLLADQEFQNILAELWSVQNDMQRAYGMAGQRLDESIQLLEIEIARLSQ